MTLVRACVSGNQTIRKYTYKDHLLIKAKTNTPTQKPLWIIRAKTIHFGTKPTKGGMPAIDMITIDTLRLKNKSGAENHLVGVRSAWSLTMDMKEATRKV